MHSKRSASNLAPQQDTTLTNVEVARYIADITIELAALAGSAKMPMLTYFLHMARVEAELQLHEKERDCTPLIKQQRHSFSAI